MKRKLILALTIIFITILLIIYKNVARNFEIYNISVTQKPNNIMTTGTLVRDSEISIDLRGFYTDDLTDKQLSDHLYIEDISKVNFEKNVNNYIFIQMNSSKLGTEIIEPTFDYLVYDNNGNVITSSVSNKNNKFLRYFMKNVHSSNKISEYDNYICFNTTSVSKITNIFNSELIVISSSVDYDKLDLSQIHILITNIRYKINTQSKRVNLNHAIYDFIIE